MDAYKQHGAEPLDWRSVLEFLEAHFDRGHREVDEVVVTNFLDSLPGPSHPGHALVGELPERLRKRFDLPVLWAEFR